MASWGVTHRKALGVDPPAFGLAVRRQALTSLHIFSIGLRSGEQAGKQRIWAPACVIKLEGTACGERSELDMNWIHPTAGLSVEKHMRTTECVGPLQEPRTNLPLPKGESHGEGRRSTQLAVLPVAATTCAAQLEFESRPTSSSALPKAAPVKWSPPAYSSALPAARWIEPV